MFPYYNHQINKSFSLRPSIFYSTHLHRPKMTGQRAPKSKISASASDQDKLLDRQAGNHLANQDHLTLITELRAANQALEEEIQMLKGAQATLKADYLKFRTMVEQATESIVVTQDLQKVYYNPAWLKLIGYSAEEYESLSLLSLIYPDDLELARETYFHLTKDIYEFRIIVKSGDIKWIANRSSRIEWEGKPAELFIVEDITERKKIGDVLAKSEAHLQRAQEIAQAGSWELDLIHGEMFCSAKI